MDELQGIVRFTFHTGMVDEFKRLSAECREIVRAKDDGTLQYDTYLNDDESEAIVLERFRDSDALILHGQNMAPLMESIMATGTGPHAMPTNLRVFAFSRKTSSAVGSGGFGGVVDSGGLTGPAFASAFLGSGRAPGLKRSLASTSVR